MASKADLFRLDPLPTYLKNRDQLIRNIVEQIDTIIELDRQTAEILEGAVIAPVKLHPQRANLATSRSTEGVEVKLSVPLEGYTPLLLHPPVEWRQPGTHGVLEAGSRDSGVSKPWLRLGHCFTADSSRVEVTEWARDVVDQIQQTLDLQTPVIEEYNVRVLHMVTTLIAARRCDIQEQALLGPDAEELDDEGSLSAGET
jgi:hypothetical protein